MSDIVGGDWASLPSGPLCSIFAHLSTRELIIGALVCKHFRDVLLASDSPWFAALCREHGYSGSAPVGARRLLAAAKTSEVWVWGGNVLGLASSRLNRFTTPERVLLTQRPASDLGQGQPTTAAIKAIAAAAASDADRQQGLANVREVCAGADFVAMLTWDGAVIDSRTLSPRGQQTGQAQHGQQRLLELPALWKPPRSAIVQLAAGGCWQGKEGGGHVLALAADGSLWGWGSNHRGQLGLGVEAERVAAPAEVLTFAAAEALGRGVAGLSCGDAHSGLLLRSHAVVFAGCNLRGACCQPLEMEKVLVFCLAKLPPGAAACALSCGGHNSAVITTGGRLLLCGDNSFGQCGGGGGGRGRSGACCWELNDVGPDARWHGMPRVNQEAHGGGGQAASRVMSVCCGSGSIYALTDAGDVYAWGQGGQGELELGGNCKNSSSPSKLPWARDVARLCTSAGGRFAGVVDGQDRLLTFGCGKFGQLGHGDTNKKAVGRQVKGLQQLRVQSVAAGADFMVAITAWKCPAGGGRGGSGGGSSIGAKARPPPAPVAGGAAEGEGREEEIPPSSPVSPSFRYKEVDPGTPTRGGAPRTRRAGLLTAALQAAGPLSSRWDLTSSPSSEMPDTPRSSSSSHLPDTPTTSSSSVAPSLDPLSPTAAGPRSGRRHSGSSAASGQSGSERWGGEGRRERRRQRRWLPPDPEDARERRRRWMAEPPATEGHFSGGEGEGEEELAGDIARGGAAEAGMGGGLGDRRFRYLLRRQLKAFASSPQQRELAFPPSLSPGDRYKIHVMAEAWGLMHQSVGEGPERRLLVWKPSRSRRSLKLGMLRRAVPEEPGAGTGGSGSGGSALARGGPICSTASCAGQAGGGGAEPGASDETAAAAAAATATGDISGSGSKAPSTARQGPGAEHGCEEGLGVEGEAQGSGDGELFEEEVLYAQAADSVALGG